jgi:hypothetical protein
MRSNCLEFKRGIGRQQSGTRSIMHGIVSPVAGPVCVSAIE